MPSQPNLFSKPTSAQPLPGTAQAYAESSPRGVTFASSSISSPSQNHPVKPAPVWLQRLSLIVLVMFCLYLGVLVMVLPWWPRVWDQNHYLLMYPRLSEFLHNGIVRGVVSGLGLVDIWIGISEAIHYRDYRG
ncbi:MAG: hypothetical protein ACYC46_08830 [Acidobacteriaceae bacterium]